MYILSCLYEIIHVLIYEVIKYISIFLCIKVFTFAPGLKEKNLSSNITDSTVLYWIPWCHAKSVPSEKYVPAEKSVHTFSVYL